MEAIKGKRTIRFSRIHSKEPLSCLPFLKGVTATEPLRRSLVLEVARDVAKPKETAIF
jgi:hypothetical protein